MIFRPPPPSFPPQPATSNGRPKMRIAFASIARTLFRPGPAASGAVQPARLTRERYGRLARRVKLLSWLSLGLITAEGGIAIVAGLAANSIALIGFGLDSVIEGLASLVIVWRFTGGRMFSHAAEQRAQKLVAIQFFVIVPYVGI